MDTAPAAEEKGRAEADSERREHWRTGKDKESVHRVIRTWQEPPRTVSRWSLSGAVIGGDDSNVRVAAAWR